MIYCFPFVNEQVRLIALNDNKMVARVFWNQSLNIIIYCVKS